MAVTNQSVRFTPRFIEEFSSGDKEIPWIYPLPPGFSFKHLCYDISAVLTTPVFAHEKVPVDILVGLYSPPNIEDLDEDAIAGTNTIAEEAKVRIMEALPNAKEVTTDALQTTAEFQKDMGTDADSGADTSILPFNDPRGS